MKNLSGAKTKEISFPLGLCNSNESVAEDNKEMASELIISIAMAYPKNKLIILSTAASMAGKEETLLTLPGNLAVHHGKIEKHTL